MCEKIGLDKLKQITIFTPLISVLALLLLFFFFFSNNRTPPPLLFFYLFKKFFFFLVGFHLFEFILAWCTKFREYFGNLRKMTIIPPIPKLKKKTKNKTKIN